MKKLLGYVRVSTKGQSDNFSIDDQIEKIKAYCNLYNFELTDIFHDIKSGSNIENRKGLNDLLERLNGYDGLIVFKLDRLSRSAKNTLELLEILNNNNKTLISVSEQFDFSSHQGKLFLTMLAGFSEYERDVIKERMTNGRNAKKLTGVYAGGRPKLGKKINHEVIENRIVKTLVDDPKELEIIKKIKNHKRAGKSIYQITSWLNDNGYKTKSGKEFTQVQVKRALEK